MNIHLPKELESSIQDAVHGGHFKSLDDAMAEAARLLLRDLKHRPQPPAINPPPSEEADATSDPLMGIWQDYAEEMDEIVADAYRHRREDKWRDLQRGTSAWRTI